MGLITGNSRLSHHTLTTPSATFSVPTQEDFTISGSQSWTSSDLALSEIGVNESDNKAYIRVGSTINEIGFASATPSYSTTLVTYQTTDGVTASVITIPISLGVTLVSMKVTAYNQSANKYIATSQETHAVIGTASVTSGSNTFFLTNTFAAGATTQMVVGTNSMVINVRGESGKDVDWRILYEIL